MRALGIGDLHLTDHLGLGGLSKYIDNHDAMVCGEVQRVLRYAEQQNVRNIIFYGDICENPRMSYSGMLELSKVLSNKEFEFFIIPGNHDTIGRTPEVGHSLEVVSEFEVAKRSNIHIYLAGADVKIDGALVRFLPFPRDKFHPKALNVCHLDVYGATTDNGRQILNEERDQSDCVAVAGHIHTNQVVRNTYYSGTLYQTCFGEKPKKFFHSIEFNGPQDFEITSVPFKPKYRLHTITVQTASDIPHDLKSTDLVKLVLQDGAQVTADDYKHLNVCVVRNFQSKAQLASVLTEDLPSDGIDHRISTTEFFNSWVSGLDVPDKLKASVQATRKRILSSLR